jgi:AhpD family alkylhydroperoxidase
VARGPFAPELEEDSSMNRSLFVSALVLLAAVPGWLRAESGADPLAATRADMRSTLGFEPSFFAAFPPAALPGAWQAFKALQISDATALSGKEKELIGLAVAAQIPCDYCVYAHEASARAHGASDAEIAEAVAMAALTRQWSTVLNGSLVDEAEFRAWADAAFAHAAGVAADSRPIAVVDADSALAEASRLLGTPPSFLSALPAATIPGAWQELAGLQLDPATALPGYVKELIGLGVAAQVPCRYCTYAHTKAAKLGGATDQQVQEALAMAALTRHWSTWLNGMAVDAATFRQEFDAILRHGAEAAAGPK